MNLSCDLRFHSVMGMRLTFSSTARGSTGAKFSLILRSLRTLQALPPAASWTPAVPFGLENMRVPPAARTLNELSADEKSWFGLELSAHTHEPSCTAAAL